MNIFAIIPQSLQTRPTGREAGILSAGGRRFKYDRGGLRRASPPFCYGGVFAPSLLRGPQALSAAISRRCIPRAASRILRRSTHFLEQWPGLAAGPPGWSGRRALVAVKVARGGTRRRRGLPVWQAGEERERPISWGIGPCNPKILLVTGFGTYFALECCGYLSAHNSPTQTGRKVGTQWPNS